MNDSTFTGVHGAERECETRTAHSAGSVFRHGSQFCFSRGAKPFNVKNKPLPIAEASTERLIQQVLQCVKQFATFSLQ
jgi:hypothetical protein